MKLRRAHRRQATDIVGISEIPTGPGITGSTVVETDIAATNSLLINPSATGTNSEPTDIEDPSPLNPTTSNIDPEETDKATTSGATSSPKHISIGTVVGICVGVFVLLTALLLLVLWLGRRSRRKALGKNRKWATLSDGRDVQGNTDRRKSGREFWTKMDDDQGESHEKYAMAQRSPHNTGAGDGGVARSMTMKSTKSNKTTRSLYGGGLGFANTFTTPDLPPQLEFTDQEMGKGVAIPRVKAPFTREHDPVSWDGETIANTSFLSLKSDHRIEGLESGAVSPSMVVSRQTPTAIELEGPQWEAAELVSPVGEPARRESRNPFLDPPVFTNPFADKAHGSSPSLISSQSAYSTGSDNNRAMASLLAALNFGETDSSISKLGSGKRVDVRQSNTSAYSDGIDENVSKFPLPPSHTDRQH